MKEIIKWKKEVKGVILDLLDASTNLPKIKNSVVCSSWGKWNRLLQSLPNVEELIPHYLIMEVEPGDYFAGRFDHVHLEGEGLPKIRLFSNMEESFMALSIIVSFLEKDIQQQLKLASRLTLYPTSNCEAVCHLLKLATQCSPCREISLSEFLLSNFGEHYQEYHKKAGVIIRDILFLMCESGRELEFLWRSNTAGVTSLTQLHLLRMELLKIVVSTIRTVALI
jgi:hypothetical protein